MNLVDMLGSMITYCSAYRDTVEIDGEREREREYMFQYV